MDYIVGLTKTKRGRALIELLLFFIFVIWASTILSGGKTSTKDNNNNDKDNLNNNVETVVNAVDKFKSMQKYEFEIEYDINKVTGKRFRNNICYKLDKDYCYSDLSTIGLDYIYKYMPNNIIELVNNGSLKNKQTDYEEEYEASLYKVPDSLIETVELYEKDNTIFKVIITFVDKKIVVYNYFNISKVEEFEVEV